MAKHKVTDKYEDLNGAIHDRASIHDFRTVRARIFHRTIKLAGNASADKFVLPGVNAYNTGLYAEALNAFLKAVELFPALHQELQSHIHFCRKVLATPLDERDLRYEDRVQQWNRKPSLLRAVLEKFGWPSAPEVQIRCKWCGHYVPFIDPNVGFAYLLGNNCGRCGRGYPMPDYAWDGLDGLAYIYYRGSVTEKEFYAEFERDYDVDPITRVVDGKWTRQSRPS